MAKSMWGLDAPRRTAMLVWGLGVLLSLGLGWSTQQDNRSVAERRLEEAASSVAQHVVDRITLYEHGLRGTRGAIMAAGGEGVTRSEFEAYVASREMRREFPGARGFGFIRRVPREAEAAFVADARAEGPDSFAIRELAPHNGERYVIQYIYPLADNSGATGLDVASEINRREAATSAMDSGEARLTAPITLVQASGKSGSGFLMLMPVYRTGLVPVETETRRKATVGWAYAPLVADEMLADLGPLAREVAIRLTDTATTQPFLQRAGEPDASGVDLPSVRREVTVAGRQWVLEVQARTPLLDAVQVSSPLARVGQGVLVSTVLALVLWLLLRRRQAGQALVPLDYPSASVEGGRLGVDVFLRQRLTLVVLLAYVVAVVLLIFMDQSSRFNAGLRQARSHLESMVKVQADAVESRRAFRRKSVVFLASTSEVEAVAYSRLSDTVAAMRERRALERLFAAYLKANPELHSLRLTGLLDGGRELFRVERRGETVVAVPPQELRAEPAAVEVVQAARLGQGEVFVSDISLLRQHGEVVRPSACPAAWWPTGPP
jgi:CHASE1-domain containing sensor protein